MTKTNKQVKNLGSENVSFAKLKLLRTSPRKLNEVAGLIRRMHVSQALIQLTFSKRRIAKDVKGCLQSAIANAENNHSMDIDNLYIHEIYVGKSFVMKRFRPRARGRASKIEKPFSNLTIILKEKGEL
jgi:large subunit ribosomal protein L22